MNNEQTTPLIGAFKQSWLRDEAQVILELDKLTGLWTKHSDRPWRVDSTRHGTNVALISAFVSQANSLSAAVVLLYRAGLAFEALPLVRSVMELAVTASWLAVYPDRTPNLLNASAKERKSLLEGIVQRGFDAADALEQIEDTLEYLGDKSTGSGRSIKSRCDALAGGSEVYLMYRAISSLCHPSNTLADAFTEVVETSVENPWGLVLRGNPENELEVNWLGMNLAMLLRAQIAADMVLERPRHSTQLSRLARRMGLTFIIEPASQVD
ncbi:DUF5677 domain-containing protein [Plantibacter sp. VKM Ac-2876]|uniref:DUF5677 domain-containing protein n=1 Tax=Plantibacter sp. VKM Ac-2876 TaxID=2783826 RepID=UPI00188AC13F|nr:hypothetical protein [Plantibacter sp. VKM Ac-2876]